MRRRFVLAAVLVLSVAAALPRAVAPAALPARLISLVPAVTDILFALGAGASEVLEISIIRMRGLT